MKNSIAQPKSNRHSYDWLDRLAPTSFNSLASTLKPSVKTDLLDYTPGSTATITANHFQIGETVAFQVVHIEPGTDQQYGTADDVLGNNSGQGHLPWYVTDGGAGDLDHRRNGKIVTQWYVNPDDSAGATFRLTAQGQTSGKLAKTIFTDTVADLSITKTNNLTAVVPGQPVTYTIVVSNSGPYSVKQANVIDNISNLLTNVSWTSVVTQGTASGNTNGTGNSLRNFVNLSPGSKITYTVTGTLIPSATGILSNTAKITPPYGFKDTNLSNNSATDTDPITPLVDLSVTKTDNQTTAIPGTSNSYTITVTNNGPSSVSRIKLIDTIPASLLNPVFTPPNGTTYDASTGIWSGLNLTSGSSAVLTLSGTINPTATGILKNTVTVSPVDGAVDTNTSNNSAFDETTLIPTVKLSLTTAFSESGLQKVEKSQFSNPVSGAPKFQLIALPDQTVSFTIVVKNDGAAIAQNVTVFDDLTQLLPVGLKVLSVNAGGGVDLDTDGNSATGDGDRQTLEVKFDSIAPGASKTITVNAKVSSEGPDPQNPGGTTSYITPIDFQGILGSIAPDTQNMDQAIPEYHNVPISGTFYLNTNLQKNIGQSTVSFQNLNITLLDPTIVNPAPGTTVQIVQPDSVTKRLDVATSDLRGTLTNGQPVVIQTVENIFNNTNTPIVFDADLGGKVLAYPTKNQSEFLPPTNVGQSSLELTWRKPSNPSFANDFSTWTNAIAGDGNLTDPSDEKAVIDYFVNNFINKGAGDTSLFETGTFNLTNLTNSSSATITAKAGQFTPTTPDYKIVVTNSSAKVIAPNQSTQLYSGLQSALNSLNFSQTTGVVVNIAGANCVVTKLQTFRNSNPSKNWMIQQLQIDAGVSQAVFKSENGAANINFSLTNIALGNPNTVISIEGNNGSDTLIGSQLNDTIVGNNGADFIDGQGGSDVLCGGNGPDIFVLRRGDGRDTIADFKTSNDKIGLAGGLTFNQLILSGNTIAVKNNLNQPGEVLATLTGINTSTLNSSNFVTV